MHPQNGYERMIDVKNGMNTSQKIFATMRRFNGKRI